MSSGPGDIDGEVSGDEAAWRDLVARFDTPADAKLTEVPWPARESLPRPGAAEADPPGRIVDPDGGQGRSSGGLAGSASALGEPAMPPGDPAPPVPPVARPSSSPAGYVPADGTRVIRPAGDPRSYSPPDEDDDRYVPTPLPPPARLDTASKAAIAGVVGGPGYLLVATFLHWAISAEAAFVAVAAFIGGFVTLVLKLGDRPRRDDDDDGAVV